MRIVILAIALTLAAPARAAGPAPAKPVGPQFFTGRWFEIARSPNPNQKDCEAPTYEFAPQAWQRAALHPDLPQRLATEADQPTVWLCACACSRGDDLARFR